MPKNINLKIDQTTYEIIILQNKIPYISRGLTGTAEESRGLLSSSNNKLSFKSGPEKFIQF